MQGDHNPLHRVVEQHRSNAGISHLLLFFIQVRAAEEGFVLLHRLALVVVNNTTFTDPSMIGTGLL